MSQPKFAILKNDGQWSENEYSLVEKSDEFSILQDSKGAKVRIFNDRVSDSKMDNPGISILEEKLDINSNTSEHNKISKENNVAKTKTKPSKSTDAKELFDPSTIYKDISEKQTFVKSNDFNGTTACKTYVFINLKAKKRFIINTYDGIAKGGVEYPLKDHTKLVAELLKKDYKEI